MFMYIVQAHQYLLPDEMVFVPTQALKLTTEYGTLGVMIDQSWLLSLQIQLDTPSVWRYRIPL